MNDQRFFSYSATAQLVLEPFDDRIIAANQEACRLTGLDLCGLQNKRVSQLFGADFSSLIVFTQELLANGRGWSDNLLITVADNQQRLEISGRCSQAGDECHLYLSLQPLDEIEQLREQSDANQHYLSGISHWSRVSGIFQEFENENQLLLEAAGEGIYGVDAKGITNFVNPAAEHILGYSAAEMAGRNMHSMVHHSHSDGSHFKVEDCPIFSAFRDGVVQTVEDDVFWSKSGQPIDVEYTSTPILDNGYIIGAVVIFRDVSQKKAYKKALLEALAEVESLKDRLEMENAYLQEEIKSKFNHHRIIGSSPPLQNIMQQINMVAPTKATVLITGESGTGKELLARAIHESSERSGRSLIRVNCAAIPQDLFESEFFGHIKGAFTGASSDRPGRFELADGGSIFLDEVGEIPLHLQGKLLRVLQEQEFERVGEAITRRVDVRIITATNRDLKQMVIEGRFREDLYFRLNVFPIESVPLRQRKEDIPKLAQHFLSKAAIRANKSSLRIPLHEIEKLKAYDWPGNVRELENVIERQVILVRGDVIRFETLISTVNTPVNDNSSGDTEHQVLTEYELRQVERKNIIRALQYCDGRVFGKGGAAEMLEVKPTTLSSRIKKLKINKD
jgi:PAS domain S-box-containing protein